MEECGTKFPWLGKLLILTELNTPSNGYLCNHIASGESGGVEPWCFVSSIYEVSIVQYSVSRVFEHPPPLQTALSLQMTQDKFNFLKIKTDWPH